MLGKADYLAAVHRSYPRHAWLTPSQLFFPHYGRALANYIVQVHRLKHKGQPLQILEVGSGNGGAALSILDYLKQYAVTYSSLVYTCADVSQSLTESTVARVYPHHKPLFERGAFRVQRKDFKEACAALDPDVPTFVLLLEVLDNLPHDRVVLQGAEWRQVQIQFEQADLGSKILGQQAAELTDQSIKQLFQFYKEVKDQPQLRSRSLFARVVTGLANRLIKSNQDSVFLPTGFYQGLKLLKGKSAHLVAADFDYLSSEKSRRLGVGAPLIKAKGERPEDYTEFDSYLVERGAADILFPSNFNLLRRVHEAGLGRHARVAKSFQFLREFKVGGSCETRCGYNPMLEEFGNTSFLLSEL